MMTSEWLKVPSTPLNKQAALDAEARQMQLTKPPGALGKLENIAIRLASMQNTVNPCLDNIHINVFAADHGVATRGVSAFPQAVTVEMIRNFSRGGAAINVLARNLEATLNVINLGTASAPGPLDKVIDRHIAAGTADFSEQPAMSEEQFYDALNAGRQAAERAAVEKADLFIGGEMGIGNTTSASAIACVLLDKEARELTGPGTGLDDKGISRKAEIIATALKLHKLSADKPLDILRCLGGFEIVALTGAYLSCAHTGLPVLVDGFISSVAALAAVAISENSADWFIYSHASAEPGHAHIMSALNAQPLLDLGMRLGEGSGAAVAVPLLRVACDLHNNMATFAEAGVSEKTE
ncbi:Nicotinate-nucleotide--dimethylbenzimidazole phosphoribosyltransferase [hydrothermal vent metagenome]|uniref:Nicotinate-nucleotide--dimethylbenzimidazole phosphoribosyltransferase n=1 Tax=hydrothermal vent metagenome TaxID=652676 RepID=A0A3B1B6Q1_9ZZZZ